MDADKRRWNTDDLRGHKPTPQGKKKSAIYYRAGSVCDG